MRGMAIPEIQSAVWVDKPASDAKVEIRHDVPVPKPKPGEVLVKMECSGVWYEKVIVSLEMSYLRQIVVLY